MNYFVIKLKWMALGLACISVSSLWANEDLDLVKFHHIEEKWKEAKQRGHVENIDAQFIKALKRVGKEYVEDGKLDEAKVVKAKVLELTATLEQNQDLLEQDEEVVEEEMETKENWFIGYMCDLERGKVYKIFEHGQFFDYVDIHDSYSASKYKSDSKARQHHWKVLEGKFRANIGGINYVFDTTKAKRNLKVTQTWWNGNENEKKTVEWRFVEAPDGEKVPKRRAFPEPLNAREMNKTMPGVWISPTHRLWEFDEDGECKQLGAFGSSNTSQEGEWEVDRGRVSIELADSESKITHKLSEDYLWGEWESTRFKTLSISILDSQNRNQNDFVITEGPWIRVK